MSHPEVLIALRRARDLTDRDFAQPLTLDSMAQVAHLSKFHFARAFSKAFGETPRTHLTRRRIERAKDLLRAANLTITEICFLVGFETTPISRTFSRHTPLITIRCQMLLSCGLRPSTATRLSWSTDRSIRPAR